MELILKRFYFPGGTNGILYYNEKQFCKTIELPWLNNEPKRSCIPEGKYRLSTRFSKKFNLHLLVNGVPGRDLILIHPANDAAKELKGCIAPVQHITGEGKGTISRKTCARLTRLVVGWLEKGPVYLIIKSNNNDHSTKVLGANAALL